MSREILFRGKRIFDSEYVEGDLVGTCYIREWHNDEEFTYWLVDPDTIGQYIGIGDKKGTKVFEGMRVSFIDMIDLNEKPKKFKGVVSFKDGSFVIISDIATHYRWMDYVVEVEK